VHTGRFCDISGQECEAKEKRKGNSSCIEIKRMWKIKCMIIPIIQGGSNMTGTNCDLFTHKSSRSYLNHLVTGATGIVTKGLKKNLEATPEKHSVDSLQKTAVLVTSHIIQKALQLET
jgi:hypothetical protein